MYHAKNRSTDLYIFLGIIALLIIIGLLFIYSASSVYALEKFNCAHYFARKQLYGIILGMLGMICCLIIPLEFIKKSSGFIFIGSLLLTSLTLLSSFSQTIHGSSRWLHMGIISLQPSEFLKLATVLYVAFFLTQQKRSSSRWRYGFFHFAAMVSLPTTLLLLQPDFGMACTIVVTSFLLFFVVRFSIKEFFITVTSISFAATALIVRYPYRLKRIMIFLNPWSDPQGSGFQIIQSLIAIGSGGFWGVGISASKQKFFYLPMQHTDFIFSIIAEETGFLGCSFLILLYLAFLYFGMRIAWQLQNLFEILLTMGFVMLMTMQAIINLAVTLGLVPTKGMGLPFVSSGNSALISSLCFVGIIVNAWANSKKNNRGIKHMPDTSASFAR